MISSHRHQTARGPRDPDRLREVLLALALAAAFALIAAGPALAAPASSDDAGNEARAINEEDGTSLYDFSFSIRRAAGEIVDDRNGAYAYSSCDGCETLAAAMQVVLIMSDPNVVTPINEAVAVNYQCEDCATVALAYQYVLGTGTRLRFTPEGNARIAAIRREFRALERSGLPLADAVARAEALAAEVEDVLANELVPTGSAGRAASALATETPDATAAPAEDAAEAPQPEPAPAADDSGTAAGAEAPPVDEQPASEEEAPLADESFDAETTLPAESSGGLSEPAPEPAVSPTDG